MKNTILIFCLLLLACDKQAIQNHNAEELKNSLSYYKDSKTKLCFAGTYFGSQASLFTNVPCTPEVEKIAIIY